MNREPEFMTGTNPITEDRKYDSGLFDKEAEAKLLKERPDLAEGKKVFEAALVAAMSEMETGMDLADALNKLPPYGTLTHQGVTYLRTPTGENVSLKGYLTKLEKSLIEVYKKYADKCRSEAIIADQLLALKEQVEKLQPKRKPRKGKKK